LITFSGTGNLSSCARDGSRVSHESEHTVASTVAGTAYAACGAVGVKVAVTRNCDQQSFHDQPPSAGWSVHVVSAS
jgi:hypothetical protein